MLYCMGYYWDNHCETVIGYQTTQDRAIYTPVPTLPCKAIGVLEKSLS